jgi:hypothetical protein
MVAGTGLAPVFLGYGPSEMALPPTRDIWYPLMELNHLHLPCKRSVLADELNGLGARSWIRTNDGFLGYCFTNSLLQPACIPLLGTDGEI